MTKKEKILEATLELIKDHGFHGCPMSMVAKKSSVAAGTIYHHFENKDDLIMELYHYVVGRLVKVAEAEDDVELDFKSRFMRFWHTMKRFYITETSFQRFLEQFYSSPYFTEGMQVKDNPWFVWMRRFFESGIKSGELRTGARPEILSIMVHGSIVSSVKVEIHHNKKINKDDINLGEIAEIVWDGIKAQPS
ncbi:TetR/AcrR family transcriptional regulator [Echinicola strongylocentroti]|uniref:TetR/AcrR family transcriptional regulator n=1 Tax=Echinicola strongylocentroti TaxID=1795355 RepID=A0A2Z4IDC1_9BACT|nr:TetR/AcrR family transcriptional regulator [Echinicola strongylocentroti]AWW29012.1 TetR/AcrR family transcriptional regulator [Echinicola strongylocentroti]